MVPWSGGYAWRRTGPEEEIDAPPFQPGRRGTYSPKLRKAYLFPNQPQGGYELTPAGRALLANNNETLAYIGGHIEKNDTASVTDKQHAFWSGYIIDKSVVLINDTRARQRYSFTWNVKVGNKVIATRTHNGTVDVAKNGIAPLQFVAPVVTRKTDGTIELTAKIGTRSHKDTFAFRVWPLPQKATGAVTVFDPQGRTTNMLRALGYRVLAWNGKATKELLVIGRNALSSGAKPPADLNAFVRNGGRVLVMEQDPAWMQRVWGFRVSQHVSRYVFPVNAAHPVVAGLDTLDLRDWAGSSRQRPASTPPGKNEEPPHGWHWGNRGGVASAAIEKPHLAGWRPILECEFDGAYSPLMELDLGQGRATLCMLDLEERFAASKDVTSTPPLEPAADRIARQILRYVQTAPLVPRAQRVSLLGTAPKWFQMLGVQHTRATTLPTNAQLVIIAPDAKVSEAALSSYMQRGGKVIFLPRQSSNGTMGISPIQKTSVGSVEVPRWKVAAGLSPSDLRWRNEAPAWLVDSDSRWQTGAAGQMAVRQVGKGTAVWLQLDPERFQADTKTYFRFTRWRQTRAVAQVLANMGATLRDDVHALSLTPRPPTVVGLAGTWQVAVTDDRPAAAGPSQLTDSGITNAARALLDGSRSIKGTMNDARWRPALANRDGEAVARRVLDIPKRGPVKT
jgi:beta-galactosidase